MGSNTLSQGQIADALALLVRRRADTSDAAEKAAINASIDVLNGYLQDLDRVELQQAATIVARAADELEKLLATATTAPFASYVADIQKVIGNLRGARAAKAKPLRRRKARPTP